MVTSRTFKNKYNIASTRLQTWNYGESGYYFITICTKDRKHYFGEIENGEMQLNTMGRIAEKEWIITKDLRSNVRLDTWIIMPNHFHAIIIIDSVETHCNASLQQEYKNKFGPQYNNLSSIIRGFKGSTTKKIHLTGFHEFAWQSRFYDRIIRNEKELYAIQEYIKNNPANWDKDENNV